MSDDRRRYPRSTTIIRGVQIIGNLRIDREVTNISSGGVFIQDPESGATPGDLFLMEFSDSAGSFRVTGEVAYLAEDGVGVQITRADWDRVSKLAAR